MYCQRRTGGWDFWCSTRNKTWFVKLLSEYLKEDRNTIANSKDNADAHISGPASDFACEKNLYGKCRRQIHIFAILYLL